MADKKKLDQLFSKIFNVSNGSHAQHRFQTLPIIIDGKLIEFDVAFFDHAAQGKNLVLKSKRLKFSLNTEFGLLNLEARVVNDRLSVSFSSKNDYFLSEIEDFDADLNLNLTDAGWLVDNIKYRKEEEDTPAYDNVKHVIQQNSLDIIV